MSKLIRFAFLGLLVTGSIHAMDSQDQLGAELRDAVQNGNLELVQQLLAQGAPVDARGSSGSTPLMQAALFGHKKICQLLIDRNACVDGKSDTGWTPLNAAARCGRKDICQLLLESNASIDATDNNRQTSLMHAVCNNHADVCELLLQHHASVDAQDNNGRTALMHAVHKGYIQICRLLIEHNASSYIKNNEGDTALTWAARNQCGYVCHVLINAILKPIQMTQPALIVFLGMKRFREVSYLKLIDPNIMIMIARQIYERRRNLFAQINTIEDNALKQELLAYARQQLKVASKKVEDGNTNE